jgi:hypothetical protein
VKSNMTKSYTITDPDGDSIAVAETPAREEVLVTITQSDTVAQVRLNRDQFEDLCGLKYNIDVKTPAPPPAPKSEEVLSA